MIVEKATPAELLDNANDMRAGQAKLSKAHTRLLVKRLQAELERANAVRDKARTRFRRAVKRFWTAEDDVKRLERRIEKLEASQRS